MLLISKIRGDATMPLYASAGAACFDLFACLPEPVWIPPNKHAKINTGLIVEIPVGHHMALYSRSGHADKHNVRLANCVGIIDSDYRGEIAVLLFNDSSTPFLVQHKDRIAQAMVQKTPRLQFIEVPYETLSKTERGDGGFGSTDKKPNDLSDSDWEDFDK